MRHGVVISLAMLAAIGCTQSVDLEVERQGLMEADRAFARATASRGVEGWTSFFAEDGVMFRAGHPVTGHSVIRQLMAALDDSTFQLNWEPNDAYLSAAADLGYTVGRYEARRTAADGSVSASTGSYVTIWRRADDGSWEVVLDIGNPDEPPATP